MTAYYTNARLGTAREAWFRRRGEAAPIRAHVALPASRNVT